MFTKVFVFAAVGLLGFGGLVAQDNGPQLYFFTNPGCGPCQRVKPEINLLVSKGYPVTIVDTTQRPDIAQQFNVDRTPVTLLVANDQIAGRKAGYIDAKTIVGWFDSVRISSRSPDLVPSRKREDNSIARGGTARPQSLKQARTTTSSNDTVHRGTRKPASQVEFDAMRATVRLKVEDPEGISFATGTVIHSQNGECLVLTCGHVFRDAGGKGKITADIGFEANETRTFPGRLVSYNSGSKDIALVIIETGFDLPSVQVASQNFPVAKGDQVFTLGCDHGQDATIRRTRIKRQALYSSKETPNDKAKKYDIVGRPVDGRSGGGMFTAGGQLIGVCNAAAVEVDEGVYTALENIYWQLAEVNLSHLFDENRLAPRGGNSRPQIAAKSSSSERLSGPGRTPPTNSEFGRKRVQQLHPSPSLIEDTQVIVILQSKSSPERAETLVINNPSSELIEQLRNGQSLTNDPNQRFAQLRRDMPILERPNSSAQQIRAQSPK